MILVVDIGGSGVKSALWWNNELIEHNYFPSPSTIDELFDSIYRRKKLLDEKYYITGISFSVPGIANQKTGYVEGASSLHYIHELCFREKAEEIFNLPIAMENDANCATLAEITYGAGKGIDNALFLIVGTGIGGAFTVDGKLHHGHNLYAGDFGMMLINGREEWSKLGSAVHMARKVSILKGLDKDSLSGKDVFELTKKGDEIAISETELLYHYLALGIYNLQYIIDPEIIIIGGGISSNPNLINNIERHLKEIMGYGQRSPLFPKLTTCKFKNNANLIGAALNYIDNFKI